MWHIVSVSVFKVTDRRAQMQHAAGGKTQPAAGLISAHADKHAIHSHGNSPPFSGLWTAKKLNPDEYSPRKLTGPKVNLSKHMKQQHKAESDASSSFLMIHKHGNILESLGSKQPLALPRVQTLLALPVEIVEMNLNHSRGATRLK